MSIDRRKLLTNAVLGSAGIVGATALGSVGPEAVFAADNAGLGAEMDAAGLADPNFVEGRVLTIKDHSLIVKGSQPGVMNRVAVTNGTSVWKLRPSTFDKIEKGDGMYARGVRMPDGTLAADAVWVNIVNIQAHIVSISKNTINLEHQGDRVVAHVIPETSVASYNSTPAVSDLSLLRVGQHVQVLGAWVPDTNEIEVATVYAAAA
ncbi:MAG: cell wall protein [Micromonosporaceae bacterium]